MKFGPRSLDEAVGRILAHNVANKDGRRLLRKGTILSASDLDQIRSLGWSEVYVAELEAGDLSEDEASHRIARALAGSGFDLQGPTNGRTNLKAQQQGLFRVETKSLAKVNSQPGVTVATLAADQVVPAGQLAATVKIIPYGLAAAVVEGIEAIKAAGENVLWLDPLERRSVHLILHGSGRVEQSLRQSFTPAIRDRVEALGSSLEQVEFVAFDQQDDSYSLVQSLRQAREGQPDLIVIAGETAIMDDHDLIPEALRRAGGSVESVGAPVDPGNLLMLAYLENIPVLGAPGCARSPKENVVDWVLPRLLAGERLDRQSIIAMGPGGLLAEIKERPMPRRIP